LITASAWSSHRDEHGSIQNTCRESWRDDGYRRLARMEEADRGDVMIYHDAHGEPCQVGIVVLKNGSIPGRELDTLLVLSKWGGNGKSFQGLTQLPAYWGWPAEYWTNRRMP
jgi:hypothetical protein